MDRLKRLKKRPRNSAGADRYKEIKAKAGEEFMESKLKLEIVTPYGLILSEDVDEVTCTGSEGDFGVLPGHVPFFTTLKIGMLAYKKGMLQNMSSSTGDTPRLVLTGL